MPKLEPQHSAEPIDDVTKAALDRARAQIERGEGIPLEQVRENVKKRYEAWRKTQDSVPA